MFSHLFHVKWKKKDTNKIQLPTRNTYSVISGGFAFRGVELKVLSFSHPKIHSKDLWNRCFHGPSSSLGRPSCTRSKWVIACARRHLGRKQHRDQQRRSFIMTTIIMTIMMNVPSSAYGAIIIIIIIKVPWHHPCQHASWRCNAISSGSCPCISSWLF